MTYTWYYIFNAQDFANLGLVSKEYEVILDGIGQVSILVVKGQHTGLIYDDVFLPMNMSDENPFEFEGYAIYVNDDRNVFLGIALED